MKETYIQYQCGKCHRWTLALYPEKLCRQCHEKAGGFKTSVMRREDATLRRRLVKKVKENKATIKKYAEARKMLEGE